MRGRKSQKSNEPSTSAEVSRKRAVPSSSGSEDSDNEFQEDSGSEDSADLKILSNNLVKYLLNYSASKIPIKRADITKNVNVTQRQFKEVFKSCKKKLKDVYGLDVCEIQESNAPKVFIIHSQFRSAVTALQLLPDQRNELTLLFIILSYIFMKGGETQEAHLFQFLEQISISDHDVHPTFGDVSKLIREIFPRQLYLKRTKIEVEGVNEIQIHVIWGARAVKEFDKKEVLKAVADIMGKSPASFVNHYHEAFGKEPANTQSIVVD